MNACLVPKHIPLFAFVVQPVSQLCLTLCDPMDYSPPGSSVHGVPSGKNIGAGCQCPGDLPGPGIEPESPVQACRFFTTEPLRTYSYVCICIQSCPTLRGPRLIINHPRGSSTVQSVATNGSRSLMLDPHPLWVSYPVINWPTDYLELPASFPSVKIPSQFSGPFSFPLSSPDSTCLS